MEVEFWNLSIKGTDIMGYTNRIQELALLCPTMVTPEYMKIKRYIWGLAPEIQRNVTSSKPTTIQGAIHMAHNLRDYVNKRHEVVRAYNVRPNGKKGYVGTLPYCNKTPTPTTNQRIRGTCFNCGAKGHFKNNCLKLRNQNGGRAHGRAFVLRGGEARQDPKVVTSSFLLNNHYAYVLFDTGADRSFVSTAFSPFINITPTTLDTKYTIELADGKLIGADP
ncbi:reverse transcriptase domain-containing protein [Tanacetum coccineum]